jgi:hypothetical protein
MFYKANCQYKDMVKNMGIITITFELSGWKRRQPFPIHLQRFVMPSYS